MADHREDRSITSKALRRVLAHAFGVDEGRIDDVEWRDDHQRFCRIYELDGYATSISMHELHRLDPPPDPFVEAFTAIALAKHEAEKRRARRGVLPHG